MTSLEKKIHRAEKREEKHRRREEKRETKHRRREEKREAKHRRREEKREAKREAKHRRREEKREAKHRHCEDYWNGAALLFNLPSTTNNDKNVVVGYPNRSNVRYNNNFNEISEQDVATLRTMFPDCDPGFIRSCLANETDDHLRRAAERLLRTDYPKVIPASPLTPPTAPPLPVRYSFDDEAPPSYEQAMLQPPPLPKRHQRASSWDGTPNTLNTLNTSNTSSQSQQSRQFRQSYQSQQSQQFQQLHREVSDSINSAVKNLFSNFKPSTVESAFQKNSNIWTRPVSEEITPQPFPQPIKVMPKDNHSIKKGFNPDLFPTVDLRSHHVSESDWNLFINGLNSLIVVNSVYGVSKDNFGESFSVGLKWVSWMNVTMDERTMENNISLMNEYITKCNESFFIPRSIIVQLIDDRDSKPVRNTFGFRFKNKNPSQYLIVTSI